MIGLAIVCFVQRLIFRHDRLRRCIGGRFQVFAIAGRFDWQSTAASISLPAFMPCSLCPSSWRCKASINWVQRDLRPAAPLLSPRQRGRVWAMPTATATSFIAALGALLLGSEFPLNVPAGPAGVALAIGADGPVLVELSRPAPWLTRRRCSNNWYAGVSPVRRQPARPARRSARHTRTESLRILATPQRSMRSGSPGETWR